MGYRFSGSVSAVSIPERIGRYQVVGHLATGGMAEILLGKLTGPAGFQRPVVLKRVLPHLARKKEFRVMFLDEARIVAGIRHPNVVQVHELGIEQQELFLVMEYLEGESLSGVIRRLDKGDERIDHALVAHIGAEACAGLHAAHEYQDDRGQKQHLVHRDVSPQNLFITYEGSVKVLDFGIAKAVDRYSNTSTGQMKGKFTYMSPEQCQAEPLDRRSDLFSLGIVLYELSTGTRLFERDNQLLVLKAITEDPIAPPSSFVEGYPPQLERVVMKALARDRDERYATAVDMRRELLDVARELDPGGHTEERLAELMGRLFDDRMGQKEEMLRQVRQGSTEVRVPSAEIDSGSFSDPRLPPELLAGSEGTLASQETVAPGYRRRRRRRRISLMVAGGVALAAALVVGGVLLSQQRGSGADPGTAATAPTPAVAAEAAEDAGMDAGPVEALVRTELDPIVVDLGADADLPDGGSMLIARGESAPPEDTTVTISVATRPSGAMVYVDRRRRGRTPLEMELPRGEEPVRLTLHRRGFRIVNEEIVPDVDQRLTLSLRRRPRRSSQGEGADFFRFE